MISFSRSCFRYVREKQMNKNFCSLKTGFRRRNKNMITEQVKYTGLPGCLE